MVFDVESFLIPVFLDESPFTARPYIDPLYSLLTSFMPVIVPRKSVGKNLVNDPVLIPRRNFRLLIYRDLVRRRNIMLILPSPPSPDSLFP